MKNKTNKLTGFIIALFTILAFTNVKAQCPVIENYLGCPITIQLTIYSSCGTPPTACNSTPFTMYLPAGPVQVTGPCAFCSPLNPCDTRITLTQINGTNVSPISAVWSTASPGPSTTPPTGCGATANIYYDPVTEIFIIY